MSLRNAGVPRHDARAEAVSEPGLVATEHVAETGSTNTDLLARVRGCDPALPFAPVLLVAGRQTDGRGRHGRRWHADGTASLTFSLAWPLPAADLAGLSLAVGVALADALEPAGTRARIGLKWPNDLWLLDGDADADATITGRKLGGVLIETLPLGPARVAVVGVGINIGAQAAPEAASGLAWLREIDADATPASTLQRLTGPLVAALRRFEQQGWAAFAARFASRDLLRGRRVQSTGARVIEGIAAGISPQAELLVRTTDGVQAIGSGEVRVRLAGRRDGSGAALSSPSAAPVPSPC